MATLIGAPGWYSLHVGAYYPEVVKLEPLMGWREDKGYYFGVIADGYSMPMQANTEDGFLQYVHWHSLTNPHARRALIEQLEDELEERGYAGPQLWGMIEGGLRV